MRLSLPKAVEHKLYSIRRFVHSFFKTLHSKARGLFYRSLFTRKSLFSVQVKREVSKIFFVHSPNRRLRHFARVFVVSIVLISFSIYSLYNPTENVQGASYNWVQNSWAGGSSSTVGTHPGDQTGWNKYSTSTAAAVGSTVTIASSTYTFTDDGTPSTSGFGSGGGWYNGSTSSVTVSGSGTSATITLAATAGAEAHSITTSTSPGASGTASHIIGNNGIIYILNGSFGSVFKAFSTTNTTWTSKASIADTVSSGRLFKIASSTQTEIYAYPGDNSHHLNKYTIGSNSWTSLADAPGIIDTDQGDDFNGSGIALEGNYFYVNRPGTATYYRYSIAGNSWSSMASLSSAPDQYAAPMVIHDEGSDYIYYFYPVTAKLARYSITGNSWTTMTAPSQPYYYGAAVSTIGNDYIYYYPSNRSGSDGGNGFYRYSKSGDSWSTMRSPTTTGIGNNNGSVTPFMLWDQGSDYIYMIYTGGTKHFLRYTISSNTWSQITSLPVNFSVASAYREPGSNNIYISDRGSNFYIDQIDSYTYAASGNFTSDSMDLGAAEMRSISWTSTTPSGVGANAIKFQLAANNDNSTWSYVGPDGTNGTYFITNGGTSFPSTLLGKRYWRYKAFLTTGDTTVTPSLYDVTFSYTSYASTQSVSSTDDGSFSSTGLATGGGWYSGATSSVSVSGGGTAAGISLAFVTSTEDHGIGSVAGNASFNGIPPTMLRNGTDDTIYISANRGNAFYKYSIANAQTTALASQPTSLGGCTTGGDIVWTGDDYMYATVGGGTGFYRYQISNDTWTAKTSVPGAIGDGGKILRYGNEDYIYVLRGNATSTFYRYSIAGNSWSTLTSAPGPIDYGSGAYRDGNSDYIYVIAGNEFSPNNVKFYRYSIAGNSWTTMADMATPVDHNGNCSAISSVPGSDTIWAIPAGSYAIEKYSILNNQWTGLKSTITAGLGFGAFLLPNLQISSDGTKVYVTSQVLQPEFAKYTVASDSWTTISQSTFQTPFIWNTSENYMYSSSEQLMYRDVIYSNTYAASGTFTSASIDLGSISTLTRIAWTSTTPSGVGSNAIRFQIAMNNDNATWSYVGPDGTSGTYFSSNGGTTFSSAQSGYRYLRYKAYLATSNTSVTPSLDSVTFTYNAYTASGNLTSNIFDGNDPTTVVASVAWGQTVPSGAVIQFQVRAAATTSSIATSTWQGPDGTSGTYFTTAAGENTSSTLRTGTGSRYFQYKAFLSSTNFSITPTLSSVTVTYVVNASPEIRNVAVVPNNDGSVSISYEARDVDTSTGTNSPGFVTPSFQYCPGGSNCQSISSLLSSDITNKAVQTSNWNSYTATWRPSVDFAGAYDTHAVVKVAVNDNEAANNTAVTSSAQFILDTIPPRNASFYVDASVSPAVLTFTGTDTSTVRYRFSGSTSSLLSAAYVNFSSSSPATASTTYTTTTNPFTLYGMVADAYGNSSTIFTATTPEKPTAMMVQDTSNVLLSPAEVRLFVAWKATAGAFSAYKVYRSTDQSNWTLVGTINSNITNYFGDSTVTQGQVYYYRVNTSDSSGNVSYNSDTISASADGIQNFGEGGGGTPAAPVISSVSSTPGSTTAVITWDTDVLSDSAVGYSTTSGQFSATTSVSSMVNSASGVGQHSVTLTGLTPSTTYYFDVQSRSVSNMTTTDVNGGGGYSFTTTNGVAISHVAVSQVYNYSATVVWDTDAAADSYVVYSTSPSMSSPTTIGTISQVTSHSVNLTGLAAGTTYYYYVQSTNGGGVLSEDKHVINGVPIYYSFGTTNDLTGPSISNIVATPFSTYVTIAWQTSEVADSMIEYGTSTNYGTTTTLDNTLTIQHSVTVTGLTASTVYHYRIHSRDANNNETITSDQNFSTSGAADTTAPVITNVATSSISLTGAIIRWTTDEVANALVDYGTSVSYGSVAGDVSDYSTTTHAVTLSSLTGNTTYYFRVRSQDPSGNSRVSDNGGGGYTFITAADATPPVITNVTTTLVSDTSAVITWTTDEYATSLVEYSTSSVFSGLQSATTTLVQSHVITLRNLAPGTVYNFRVRSADASNNSTLDDNGGVNYSLLTTGVRDIIAPTISNVVTSSVSLSSAIIRWTTSEPANATVDYGTNNSYGFIAGDLFDFSTTTHVVTLTGLNGNLTYYFRVRSEDPSGNISVSDNNGQGYTFATVPDATAPTISNVITALYSDTSAVITWRTDEDANSQVDYSTSTVYGSWSETTSTLDKSHTITLTGLVPNTQYYYRVRSTDLSGNTRIDDNNSNSFTFTTANQPVTIVTQIVQNSAGSSQGISNTTVDGNPPSISNIIVSDITRNSATVKWTTDEPATSFVRFGQTTAYDGMSGDYTNYTTDHSVIVNNLISGTFFHFKVASQDKSSNYAESADQNFATLNDDNTVVPTPTTTPTPLTPEETQQKKFIDSVTQASKETIQKILEALLKNPSLPDLSEDTFVKAITEMANRIVLAPTIVGPKPQVTIINGTTAVVRWSTDKNSSSQVLFAKEGDYNPSATSPYTNAALSPGDLSTSHEVIIPDLAAGTIYHFQVVSKGVIGPESRSDDSIFATQSTPPVITGIQVTSPSESSATISWQTNVPTAATIEYVPVTGTQKLTQGDTSLLISHSITIKNLIPGTKYSAVIKSVDEKSNEIASDPFEFATTLDVYPPVITKVGADSTLYPGRASKVQTVISWLTDEPATSQVFYHEGTAPTEKVSTTTLDILPATKHVAVITSFKPGSVYTYWVTSADANGNATTSERFTILTPQEKETIIDIMIKNFEQVFGWTKQIGL